MATMTTVATGARERVKIYGVTPDCFNARNWDEATLGRLMMKRAREEGHMPRLPMSHGEREGRAGVEAEALDFLRRHRGEAFTADEISEGLGLGYGIHERLNRLLEKRLVRIVGKRDRANLWEAAE